MRKMRRTLTIAIVATAIDAFAPAGATTITFDDLGHPAAPGIQIANGYQGLNWSNLYVVDTSTYSSPNGYQNGTVSPTNVAFNGFAHAAAISNGLFTVNSFYLTAAWNDGLQVTVTGKNSGMILFTRTFVVDTSGPTLESLNWSGINELDFSSTGGVNHGYAGGSGMQFVLDNLTINTSPVLEPASSALFGAGLSGLILLGRKRKG